MTVVHGDTFPTCMWVVFFFEVRKTRHAAVPSAHHSKPEVFCFFFRYVKADSSHENTNQSSDIPVSQTRVVA